MKKCLQSVLFVLVVLFINNCGEPGKAGAYIATPSGEEDPFVAECENHTDCYPDHSICVSGVCTGDPQPENLPNENAPAINSEDAATATETSQGSGPWGNPNYNGSDSGASSDDSSSSNVSPDSDGGSNVNSQDSSEGSDDNSSDSDESSNECEIDLDCNDNNECTNNVCYDGQCEYDVITNCKPCTEDADCGVELADYWCDDEGNVHNASQPKCVSDRKRCKNSRPNTIASWPSVWKCSKRGPRTPPPCQPCSRKRLLTVAEVVRLRTFESSEV